MKIEQEEFKRMRKEYTSPKLQGEIKKELGDTCVNCGSTRYIEYHHIVPIVYGGTNNLSNIVPLCADCHAKAHHKANAEGIKKARREGRCGRNKITTYENAKPHLKRYFDLEIGNKELHETIGFSVKNHSGLYELKTRYREEHNIPKHFRNNIDIHIAKVERSRKAGGQYGTQN